MGKPKRKRTAAERQTRRERRKNTMIIFINGKQKRVPRPQLIDGLEEDEYLRLIADPIWLHQNEMWEDMPLDEESLRYLRISSNSEDDESPADCNTLDTIDRGAPYPPDWDIPDTAEHDTLESTAFDGPDLAMWEFPKPADRDVPF
jgi:hypothetical protein